MKRRLVIVGVAASSLGVGCGLLQAPPADAPTLHLLDALPARVEAAPRREVVLAISPPRAAPGYDTAAMVYLRRPHALEHYATHRWADTPARMLGQLLTRTLDDAGAFRAVVASGSSAPADLRLDTEVVRLQQSFLVRPSRAELTLRAQLVDLAGRRVLAMRYVEVTHDAATDDAAGGVAAANAALARALAQLAAWGIDAAAPPRASSSAPAATGAAPPTR